MHPDKKQFTYLDKSRLDKFLVSEECLNYTQNTQIVQAGIKTEHRCVTINLNLNTNQKEPGRWKLNTSILQDDVYRHYIKELIKAVTNEYNFLGKQMQWEVCKIKVRELSIHYCTKNRP